MDEQKTQARSHFGQPDLLMPSMVRNDFPSDHSIPLPADPFARSNMTIITNSIMQVNFRERVFIILHQPKGLEYLYHVFMLFPVILSCLILNMFRPKSSFDDEFLYAHYDSIHFTMALIDSLLFVLFFAEIFVRMWSAEYHAQYRHCSGKKRYFYDYFYRRMFDFLGLATYFGYLIFNTIKMNDTSLSGSNSNFLPIDIVFRFAHVLQVFQVYRVIFKLIKPFYKTMYQQANQLFLANLCVFIMWLFGSLLLYITELIASNNSGHHSVSDALWLTFECFSTVGYGDTILYSMDCKFIICIISIMGIYAFGLPSFIIGNGLSMAVQEQRRMTFKYMSIAQFIRTAISNQQITKQAGKHGNKRTNKPKKTTRLINHHLESFSRLNLLKNDTYFARVDDEEEEQAVEELWSKLLYIKSKEPDISSNFTVMNPMSKEYHQNDLCTNSERVMDTLGNMDLTRYSHENSVLWFNLNLIEEDIDRLNELDEEIKHKLNAIRRLGIEFCEFLNETNPTPTPISAKVNASSNSNDNNDQ